MGRGEEERAVATTGCGREAHVSRHSYVFITTRLSYGWQCEGGRGGEEGGEKVGKGNTVRCVYSGEGISYWLKARP